MGREQGQRTPIPGPYYAACSARVEEEEESIALVSLAPSSFLAFSKERKKKVKSLSHVQLSSTPWTVAYWVPRSMGFSRQEYWSGLPFPSPGDLPNQGSNLGLSHRRWILYQLSYQGSPTTLQTQFLSFELTSIPASRFLKLLLPLALNCLMLDLRIFFIIKEIPHKILNIQVNLKKKSLYVATQTDIGPLKTK